MKKILLTLSFVTLALASNAATIVTDNANGLNTSTGTALSAGVVRYGFFTSAANFATDTLTELNNKFFQVASYTIGSATWSGVNVTYANTGSYTAGDGTTSRAYDSTPLDNSNVTTDIAGEAVYAWVLNTASAATATEHGIFRSPSYFTWTDAQQFGSTDSSFSFDLGTPDMEVLVGTGTDGSAPHSLAAVAAIPEPSRAILGLAGLGALFFRRRRA
jgi:hypothetical protein